jgi:hypothetical protein
MHAGKPVMQVRTQLFPTHSYQVRETAGSTKQNWRALAEEDRWSEILQNLPNIDDLHSTPSAQTQTVPETVPTPKYVDENSSDGEDVCQKKRKRNEKLKAAWAKKEKDRKRRELELEEFLEKTSRSVLNVLKVRDLPDSVVLDLQRCLELLQNKEGAEFHWDMTMYTELAGENSAAECSQELQAEEGEAFTLPPDVQLYNDFESDEAENLTAEDAEGYTPLQIMRKDNFFLVQ